MKRSAEARESPAAGGSAPRRDVVAGPASAGPQKARPVKLSPEDSTEDAAICVFLSALDQFEANARALRAQEDPECVHQMRVALRRLRAAIGLFRNALSGPALDAARERAKAIASVLGAARDWDVFREMLEAGPRAAFEQEPSFFALLDAVASRRAMAYAQARAKLDETQAVQFVAEFRAAIELRDWNAAADARDEGSAKGFAQAALTRLRKRVMKKSRGLADLSPEDRHQARIALKKARYGAEFFQSLFPHRRGARRFSRALAELQDGLGAFNDMETVTPLLDEIDAGDGGVTMRASAFVRGWFAHAARAGVEHARESEKRLKELAPFWS